MNNKIRRNFEILLNHYVIVKVYYEKRFTTIPNKNERWLIFIPAGRTVASGF